MVKRGLKATLTEPAVELRALAVERLDHMLSAIWTAATNGDLQAQAGVLRLEERRAKLLGHNAPEKVDEVGDFAEAKAALLAKLNKMAERMRPIFAPQPEPLVTEHVPTHEAAPTVG